MWLLLVLGCLLITETPEIPRHRVAEDAERAQRLWLDFNSGRYASCC